MTIELTDKEALLFRALMEANALEISSGSVTIHFDVNGRPATVEVVRHTRLSTGG